MTGKNGKNSRNRAQKVWAAGLGVILLSLLFPVGLLEYREIREVRAFAGVVKEFDRAGDEGVLRANGSVLVRYGDGKWLACHYWSSHRGWLEEILGSDLAVAVTSDGVVLNSREHYCAPSYLWWGWVEGATVGASEDVLMPGQVQAALALASKAETTFDVVTGLKIAGFDVVAGDVEDR